MSVSNIATAYKEGQGKFVQVCRLSECDSEIKPGSEYCFRHQSNVDSWLEKAKNSLTQEQAIRDNGVKEAS